MIRRLAITLFIIALLPLAACRVEQEREGELPEVSVEGGQLPQYDVEPVDVDVDTETRRVEVPTGIETEEREVTVPDVDVNPPDDDRNR
jgi:hypothetical protein